MRGTRAEEAQQRARIAEKEAEAERARAEAHQARADMHERGLADDELMGDRDRDRDAVADRDVADTTGRTRGDRYDGEDDRQGAVAASDAGEIDDYQRGRRDEARDEGR